MTCRQSKLQDDTYFRVINLSLLRQGQVLMAAQEHGQLDDAFDAEPSVDGRKPLLKQR